MDRSLQICEEFGCKIRIGEPRGIGEPHRPALLRDAQNDWILQMDPDEFLSQEAQNALPELVQSGRANCYALLWPIWNGSRYTTTNWPYKKVLYRRSASSYLGVPHEEVRVNGAVANVPVRLEHQPSYNNMTIHTMRTKWDRWLTVHASILLSGSNSWDVYPDGAQLQPHYSYIAKRPLLSCAPLFGYHLLATMALGGWREGPAGLKVGVYTSLYYAALCLRVWRLKRKLDTGYAL
jgi:hypothetical protein